jgi:hypothetical protein
MQTKVLSSKALQRIVGIKRDIPMTPLDMARTLRIAFFPCSTSSEKLRRYLKQLKEALIDAGAEVLRYEQALAEGTHDRIGKGIVLIAPGEGEPGNLAIDHVSSLTNNTVVGVLDGTLPELGKGLLQRRVDALVSALVWHMAHAVIYVDELSWTMCTMNGGIDTFGLESMRDRVLDSLVPKLAAPVVPPQKDDFEFCENAFDPSEPKYNLGIHDLMSGAEIWGRTGLIASQTKLETLTFRNQKYRRIASAFLNQRTGMSYGFLAHQLQMRVFPAIALDEAASLLRRLDWEEKDFIEVDGNLVVVPKLGERRFVVPVPEVTVLCTRSGCDKIRPDPSKDLVTLTLTNGKVRLGAPKGLLAGSDCQPSFDTSTIVSHAVGNAIIASILCRLRQNSNFVRSLKHRGLAIAHWHGYPARNLFAKGYHIHGRGNPPVSCSTSQAAIFSLSGKLAAFASSIEAGEDYLGDVHVEPSHGTNLNGPTLADLAALACECDGELLYAAPLG